MVTVSSLLLSISYYYLLLGSYIIISANGSKVDSVTSSTLRAKQTVSERRQLFNAVRKDSVLGESEEKEPEYLIDASFWSAFYNLLHNVTHPHLPHPHHHDDPKHHDETASPPTNDDNAGDDTNAASVDDTIYIEAISNDPTESDGVVLTWQRSVSEGGAAAGSLVAAAACVGLIGAVVVSRRRNANGNMSASILGWDSEVSRSGIVKRRFESFGQFLRKDNNPASRDMLNESGDSQIEFVQIP